MPLLREFGMQAGVFISAGMVGTPGWLASDEVQQLTRQGVVIGSHGISHRLFSTLSIDELEQELRGSKHRLEQMTGQAVDMLSLPGGRTHPELAQLATKAGYKAIFTSQPGLYQPVDGLLGIRRIPVKAAMTLSDFERLLKKDASWLARLERSDRWRRWLRAMVGERAYGKIYGWFANRNRR
jgi:peptidoglycan/xylan/chitin deacetylase (PgdA/CDA1 family)